jgi:hypothetical protein
MTVKMISRQYHARRERLDDARKSERETVGKARPRGRKEEER